MSDVPHVSVGGQGPSGRRRTVGAEESRLSALDGLRGIAASAVLLIHIGYVGGNPHLMPAAALGVDLFFILSGFVIGYAFEPKLLQGMRWRRFMALRAARFFPGLAIGVALAAAVQILLGQASGELGLQVVLHLLLLPDVTSPALFPLNGVLWTLFFELIVNAGHAAVVRRLSTRLLVLVVILCGCAWAWTAGQTGNWGGGWNWATVAGGFARVGWAYGIGLLLYRLTASGAMRVPTLPAFLPVTAAAVLLLAPTFELGTARFAVPLFLLLPLTVVLTAHSSVGSAGRRIASWAGELSYPLYTMHPPLLLIAAWLIGAKGSPASWAIAGLLIVVTAAAAAHLFETPARKWLRHRVSTVRTRPI